MKLLWFLLLTLYPLILFSQGYELNHRYPGYFINKKADTIRGFILLSNKLDNQIEAEYSNDSKGEKLKFKLSPDEVKGFKVQDRVYTSINYGNKTDPIPEHFLLTIEQGTLKLYQYFRLLQISVGTGTGEKPASGDDEQYLESEFVIVNGSGKQYVIASQNSLIKYAEDLFGEHPALLQKINEREKGYRYNDLPLIVKEFNSWLTLKN